MMILTEHETIHYIIKNHTGIARYGDGELKLCSTGQAISQPRNAELQKRLCEILRVGNNECCLIGIPRIDGNKEMPYAKHKFWARYLQKRFTKFYREDMTYGSAFITRPDSALLIDNPEYYNLVKEIWKDRKILLYQGTGRRFLKAEPNLFETAKSYEMSYGPAYDAFASYDAIIYSILNSVTTEDIVVLSLGPTATVLAYDLSCKYGIQALDLGHLGMFYAHIHPKDRQYDGSPYPKDGEIRV